MGCRGVRAWDKDIGSVQHCSFFVGFLIWREFPEDDIYLESYVGLEIGG